MIGRAVLCGLVLASSVASAKPLPAGMKVSLAKKKVMVSKDGVTLQLDDSPLETDKLSEVGLSDDGTSITFKAARCDGMFDDGETSISTVSLAVVEAKIENVLGMKLHGKKKYADAIPHFTLAAQKDPATPLYATNLLSAQAMGGKLDDADKTIATHGKLAAPWFLWRLAVDPELKVLKDRPAAKLAAAKAGTAKGDLRDKIAYSPLGFAATETYANQAMGIPDGSSEIDLLVVELTTGKEVLRLRTEETCATDMETGKPTDKGCVKKLAAKTTKQRNVANALLAQLGFEVLPNALTDLNDKKEVTAADGRKLVTGDKLTLVVGKTKREIEDEDFKWVAFVPKALVLGAKRKTIDSCSGDGLSQIYLSAVATP